MEFQFDEAKFGVDSMSRNEDKQLCIFEYGPNELPPLPNTEKTKKKTKTTKRTRKNTKSKTKTDSGQINIDSIKKLEEKKEFKEKGTGTISITGATKSTNSVVNAVSDKTKKDIEKRNKELLRIREHPYIKRESLLTNAEKHLYKFLRLRLGKEVEIFSKVRLADIVDLNEAVTRDSKAFYKIAYKHVDFAIMSPQLDLICVVELDDYTHEDEKVKQRDAFVAQVLRDCAIPFFRINCPILWITSEETRDIEMCVLEYMAPTCPKCGRPMEPKESKQKFNYGHRFYGCMGFYEHGDKQCRYTIDID